MGYQRRVHWGVETYSSQIIGMMKISIFALLATVCVAVKGSKAEPSLRINCQECIGEMHSLGRLIKEGAPAIEAFLRENYCPDLEGHEEQCAQDLTHNYVEMLFMIINHFFVDGAQHICMAWGVCNPQTMELIGKEPRPYTCEQCVQAVKRHFPPMHELTINEFWNPQELCDSQPVCGASPPTKPPTRPPKF